MMDYINGNRFSMIADYRIDFDHERIDFDLTVNAIIFCKTDFLDQLFKYVRNSKKKYILITHMSDRPIDEDRFNSKPDCIKKWYAQNAVYDHPDLISIPLGLENHIRWSKGKFTDHSWFIDNIEGLRKTPKNVTLYCNWNKNTNKERSFIIEQLEKTDVNFHIEGRLSFKEYCNHMAQYKFIVCPPGNGVDTHRVWEALYIGGYPIVIKNRIYRDYDLSIIQVNDYSEINYGFLGHFLQKQYSNTMMNMAFWTNKIAEEYTKL